MIRKVKKDPTIIALIFGMASSVCASADGLDGDYALNPNDTACPTFLKETGIDPTGANAALSIESAETKSHKKYLIFSSSASEASYKVGTQLVPNDPKAKITGFSFERIGTFTTSTTFSYTEMHSDPAANPPNVKTWLPGGVRIFALDATTKILTINDTLYLGQPGPLIAPETCSFTKQ